MSHSPLEVRLGTTDDLATIRGLLRDCQLPLDDLETAAVDFTVAIDGTGLLGAIGLESFGANGLLRSLAVRNDHRGRGIGEKLVGAVEARAAALGMQQLVLLTETAAAFFAKRGYTTIVRDQAPSAIRNSMQFRQICPASATCMIKPLESHHD